MPLAVACREQNHLRIWRFAANLAARMAKSILPREPAFREFHLL
jgi:hypothetical protein